MMRIGWGVTLKGWFADMTMVFLALSLCHGQERRIGTSCAVVTWCPMEAATEVIERTCGKIFPPLVYI